MRTRRVGAERSQLWDDAHERSPHGHRRRARRGLELHRLSRTMPMSGSNAVRSTALCAFVTRPRANGCDARGHDGSCRPFDVGGGGVGDEHVTITMRRWRCGTSLYAASPGSQATCQGRRLRHVSAGDASHRRRGCQAALVQRRHSSCAYRPRSRTSSIARRRSSTGLSPLTDVGRATSAEDGIRPLRPPVHRVLERVAGVCVVHGADVRCAGAGHGCRCAGGYASGTRTTGTRRDRRREEDEVMPTNSCW